MPQLIPAVVTTITAVLPASVVTAAAALTPIGWGVAAAGVVGAGALANEAFKAIQPQVKSSSAALEWNADPNAPNRFAFGRVGGAGNIIHNATYGPDKMFVGFVGVMSASGPIKSWQAFKADDAFVSFDASGKAINTEYANEMYLGRQRGRQPEPSYLPSPSGLKNGAAMPRWGASYKLSGKAAYMYTLAENSKRSAFKGKVPTGIHYIEGLYCYDPRFDSTYPGGTGHCRIDDPTTWVYSTNAYIHALNWNIGRWEGEARGFTPARYGVPYASMKVGGIGATPEGIDFSGYVEAANVFDENAWACAAWPDADQSKAAVLDSFLQAGGGIYAERQGKISCLHRAAPRTSVVTITADDTAGTIEYDTTTSLLERINTIRPEYWSEAHGWQMVATDEVTSSAWREEDGQGVAVTRSKGLAYNYVPQSKQARELAALQIAHTREGIRGTAPLRHYLDLEVGDCFTFEVPEAVLNGQKCIVLNVDPDLENDIIHVTFASESDGKYAFAFGQADAPPPAPALQPADNTVSPPLPGDWTITPRPPAPGGGQLPVIDLSGIVSNATADAMLINWREVVEGEDPDTQPPFMDEEGELLPGWVDAGVWPPTTRTLSIQGPQPGAQIWIAIRYKRGNNVSLAELAGPITVGDLIAGGLAPDAAQKVVQEVIGKVGEAQEDTETARRQAELTLETILNEQQSLEAEAAERLAADTGVLNESKSFTDGKIAQAMNTVYTKAETDAGLASTLQDARSYTDDFKSEASLTFSTKAERASGDAIAVLQAKAYTDDFKSEASLTYATQASLASGLASTLNSSQSYTDGKVATAISTVYTKAEVDAGRATTLQEAKSYTDAASTSASLTYATKAERANGDASTLQSAKSYTDDYKSEASLLFASQSSLNGVSATAALALNTAVAADGKVKAKVGLVTEVGGLITGISSENDGVRGSVDILSTVFNLYSTGSGVQTSYIAGVWYILDPGENTRTLYGKAFGGAQKLVWWTGSNSVPLGGETKANAYVYISMNTVGGPRFGGSDVPTGGGGGGSGVIGWSGVGSAASAPPKNLPAGTLLRDMQFTVGGGSINNPSGVSVLVYVYAGVTVMGQSNLFIESSGDMLPDGSWQANYASFQLPNMPSPASGSVGFSLQIMSVTGGSIVRPMEMTGSIFAVVPL